MPSPQVEDGYTRIADELLDAIVLFPFSKRQLKVMLALIRRTYGFGKKEDDITVTRLAEYTGLTRPHTSATLDELVALGAVLKRDGRYGYVLGIQKDYSRWQASRNGTRPETGRTPSQNGTPPVPKQDGPRPETGRTPSQNGTHNKHSPTDNPNRQPQETLPIDTGVPGGPGAPPAAAPKPAKPKRSKEPAKTAATWQSYADAYYARYGVEPVRNARINAQLGQLVDRLGAEDAPHVAAYFMRHNGRWYVEKGHTIGILLNDAEKLRTEWATGRQVTSTQARQTDQTQTRGNVFNELLEEHRNGKLTTGSGRHG